MGEHAYVVSGERKSGHKCSKIEIVLCLTVVALIGYVLYLKNYTVASETSISCEEISCYESSVELNNFIDSSVDPCDDFHEFVCGKTSQLIYTEETQPVLVQQQEDLENYLDAMIVSPISSQNSRPIQIQKLFFQKCLNLEEIEADNNTQILMLINEIGGWPLREDKWKQEDFDWKQVLVKCRKLGLPFQWFLEFGIHVQDERNYFKISPPTLKNSTKKLDETVKKLIGKNFSLRYVVDFERRLQKILNPVDNEITIRTIQELQKIHPPLNQLSDFLNNITEESYAFTEETEIASNIDDYILRLHMLLTSTSKSTQANYIVWKILENFAPYIESGVEKNSNRFEYCKQATKEMFPNFSEIEYIRESPISEIRNSVEELVSLVKNEFVNRIQESTWLNTTAGEIYLEQFENSEVQIGSQIEDFPDAQYLQINNLVLDSENITIIEIITARSKSYFDSVFTTINETSFNPEENFSELMKAGIYYNQNLNKMVLPPPVLHEFSSTGPQFLNFARVGFPLAKEYITNLRLLTQNEENLAFQASDKCLSSDYTTLIGKNEFSRVIISDIVGLDISYKAYQKWIATHGEESQLPLLPYTPNQLFWISSSLINCQLIDSKYTNHLSVRHSRYFPQDFSCGDNTPMNPQQKC